MVAGKSMDCLPPGWTEHVEVKNGRKLKYYSNMETGKKFYSKQEIIRYLETGNPCRGQLQQKSKHNNRCSKSKPMPLATETNEIPEWLPPGWIMELKTRNRGPRIGRTYKCYIDPLTGSKFYSKPEVSEYLRTAKRNSRTSQQKKMEIGPVNNPNMDELTGGKTSLTLEDSQMKTLKGTSLASEQKQIVSSKQSVKKVVIERVAPDGLPPGWIKEIKIEKKGNGIRKDSYYTDPVSGYAFLSVKDALRYLETGDLNRCAIKPKKRDELEFLNEETSVPSAPSMQDLGHHTTRRQLFSGLGVSADATITSALATEILVGKHSLDNATEESVEMKKSNDPISSLPPKSKGSQRKRGERACAENGTVSTPLTEMARKEKLAENDMGENRNTKVQIDYSKSKNKTVNSRFRSSKRLAGLKPEVAVNLALSEQVLRAAARKSGESEAKPSPPDNLSHSFPSNVELSNRSKMPLEDQIVPDNQSVKQETDKKDEENTESQLLSPFGDSWSDPSLDFVVKTLTGSILSKENLAIQGLENSVARSLETTDAEALQKRQCTSVSDDSMNTSTSTTEILKGKHSVDNAIEGSAKLKVRNDPPLPRTEDSKRKRGQRVCAENGTVPTPSTGMVREEKLSENGMGENRNRKVQIDYSKSKKKGACSLPCRSSKRLAGSKPEMEVNLALSEHILRAEARKSGESDVKPSLEDLDNVAHNAPRPFNTLSDTQIAHHAVTGKETQSNVELSKSKKPLEDQAFPEHQPVRQDTEKKDEENIESQLLYPFGDSWADPCLEFAIKTLTGAIPIEDNFAIQGMENRVTSNLETTYVEDLQKRQCTSVSTDTIIMSTSTAAILEVRHPLNNMIEECAKMKESNDPSGSTLPRTEESKRGKRDCAENGTISTPSYEMVRENNLAENSMGENRNSKMKIDSSNSKKKEARSLPCRSSKRLAGHKPEMVVNLALSEHVLRAAARMSGESEAKPFPRALDDVAPSGSQPFETVSDTEIAQHAFTGTEPPLNVELSTRSEKPMEVPDVPEDQPMRQETEKKDEENIESQILYPFGDSWSDPCLEFAFKTLTGAIPIEDNLVIQGLENSVTTSNLETADAESLQKRQCMSVSADAMITVTTTAEILEVKNSIDNAIVGCAEMKEINHPSSSPLPRTEGSKGNRGDSENGNISTPSTEILQEAKLAENCMGENKNRKMKIDSSKSKKRKASSLPCRSSKRLAGSKPEMQVNLALSEHNLRVAARKSGESEANPSPAVPHNVPHVIFQPFETLSEMEIAHHALTSTEAPSNIELSNRTKQPLEDQTVPEDQPVRQETEKKDEENLESQLLYPFADSWSDPCLEFAFKTLTGAIPIEDNFSIQGYFEHQEDDTSRTQTHSCSALPEFTFPNFFQSAISSDFDATGTPMSVPQLPANPMILPPGNAGLPTCSSNAPQQPSLDRNKEHQTKVNS
ncbi:hypothetical protein ACSBR2_041085 [Camellia fascicularis]